MTNAVNLYAQRLLEDNELKIRTLHRALQDRHVLLRESAQITAALRKFRDRRKQRRRASD